LAKPDGFCTEGQVEKVLPWDVRAAIACMAVLTLVMLFGLQPGLFMAIYLAVCFYVAVKLFRSSTDDSR
jgi:hypothetical protein